MTPIYSIILPAWNEEHTVEQAITRNASFFASLNQPFEILVIDDGSTDKTPQKVEQLKQKHSELILIQHSSNQGKGAAIQTGMRAAKGEIRIFQDCDLSVSPETARQYLSLQTKSDILIGSRRIPGANIAKAQPWIRTQLGTLFNWLIRLKTGLPYRDTQCGFKIFHARTLPIFEQLRTKGWSFDVELLLRAKQHGFSITEIPVTWHNGNESKLRLRDAWKIGKEIYFLE